MTRFAASTLELDGAGTTDRWGKDQPDNRAVTGIDACFGGITLLPLRTGGAQGLPVNLKLRGIIARGLTGLPSIIGANATDQIDLIVLVISQKWVRD